MIKLLLVEDDANLSYIVKCGLEDEIEGYEVTVAVNGKEGLDAYRVLRPNVIITDVEMPVMDGFEMVSRIRETDGDTPIIFASARILPKDVTYGYKTGGDNYIKKPFIPAEMDAHIKALLRNKGGERSKNETRTYLIGDYVLDAAHAKLKSPDQTISVLTSRESNILELLCKNREEVVRRDAILSQFWETDNNFFASRSLDVFITKLRKLFAGNPDIEIQNVRGVGLMLHVEPPLI